VRSVVFAAYVEETDVVTSESVGHEPPHALPHRLFSIEITQHPRRGDIEYRVNQRVCRLDGLVEE
jgi:hypothetical protein